MNITVYLGASLSNKQELVDKVRELGNWIGSNNHNLVYGGSKCGLMGQLAESCLLANGKVIGVEPKFFIDAGFDYPDISELIVTKDMTERKTKMIELGDVFIAFPGGTGTLEEISEVMSKITLKHLDKPCILYNLNGYYDDLKNLVNKMLDYELTSKDKLEGIYFCDNLLEIIKVIGE